MCARRGVPFSFLLPIFLAKLTENSTQTVPTEPSNMAMQSLKDIVKRSHHGRRASRDNGSPQAAKIVIPRSRTDDDGQPIQRVDRDLHYDALRAGLEHVSHYLANHGRKVEVIAVGGAVNVLRLLTRKTTRDINLFGVGLDNEARILIDNAAFEAQKKFTGALGTHWLNTEAEEWVSGSEGQELTSLAVQQNVTLYQGSGLVVYAAPWEYAFTCKIHHIQTGGNTVHRYDLEDAVHYLHQYIRHNLNQTVPIPRIQGWAQHWRGFQIKDSLIADIQNSHKIWYRGQPGLEF